MAAGFFTGAREDLSPCPAPACCKAPRVENALLPRLSSCHPKLPDIFRSTGAAPIHRRFALMTIRPPSKPLSGARDGIRRLLALAHHAAAERVTFTAGAA